MILPGPKMMVGRKPIPAIGAAYEGGFFAGQIQYPGQLYNLVISPKSVETMHPNWKTSASDSPGTESLYDGWANTNAMNDASHPPAQYCRGLSTGGFSDWYLPALYELDILYFNLKPTADANANYGTYNGANPYAVPPKGNNTSSVPPRTSVALFQSPSGSESLQYTFYWSSSQSPANDTQVVMLMTGEGWAASYAKYHASAPMNGRTRPIRRVAA